MESSTAQIHGTNPIEKRYSYQISGIPMGSMAVSVSSEDVQQDRVHKRYSTPVHTPSAPGLRSSPSGLHSDNAEGTLKDSTLTQQLHSPRKIVRRKAVSTNDRSLSSSGQPLNGSASVPLPQTGADASQSDRTAESDSPAQHRNSLSTESVQAIRPLTIRKQKSSRSDTSTSLSAGTGSANSDTGSSPPTTPLKSPLEPSSLSSQDSLKSVRAKERKIAEHAQNGGDPDAFGPFSPSHFVKLTATQPEHQEDAAAVGARAARHLAEAQSSDASAIREPTQREARLAASPKAAHGHTEADKTRKPQAAATMLSTVSASPIKKLLGPPPPLTPKSADRPRSAPFNNLQSVQSTPNATQHGAGTAHTTPQHSDGIDHRASGPIVGKADDKTAPNVRDDDPEAQLAPFCPLDREPEPDLHSMMTRRSSSTSSSTGDEEDDEDDLIDGRAIEAFPLPSSVAATPTTQIGSPRTMDSQQNTPRPTSIKTPRPDLKQPTIAHQADENTEGQEWDMAEELEIRDRVFRAEMKRPNRADKARRRAARKVFDVNRMPTRKDVYEASLLSVRDEYGNRIRFGSLFEGQPTIVLFIRHFWCSQCQDYVDDIVKVRPEVLERHKVRLIIVSNGSWKMIKPYKKLLGDKCPFPIYTDRGKFIYTALGMVLRTFNANKGDEVGKYIKHSLGASVMVGIVNGAKLPIKPPGDQLQLGGEFILGPGLDAKFAHRMKGTRDHEQIETICGHLGIDLEDPSASYEAFSSHGTPVLQIGASPSSPLSSRIPGQNTTPTSANSGRFKSNRQSDHVELPESPKSVKMSSFGITSNSTGSKATPVRLRAKPSRGKASQGISSNQIGSAISLGSVKNAPQLPTPPHHSPLHISITPSQTVSTFSLHETGTINGDHRLDTQSSTTPTQETNRELLTPTIELTPPAVSPISSHMSRFSSSSSEDSSHVLSRLTNTFRIARLRVAASNGSIRNSINMETGSLHSYHRG